MGKKVESYLSDDGKLFTSERDMVLHEIEIALGEEFPELRVQMPLIMKSIDRITAIVQPLHILHMKNHPEAPEETTRDWGELAGTCDCSASLSGNSGPHHPTCPSYKPVRLADWYNNPQRSHG